jgi:pyruvate dehydrogenase E1 component
LRSVQKAQKLLAEKYDIGSTVWSVTSYKELRKDAHACRRWNMLHPEQPKKKSYVAEQFDGLKGPFVAASDNVRAVAEQIDPWVPGGLFALGTDGFGRSETRENLRRHFEVDAECVAIAALYRLAETDQIERSRVAAAIKELGVDPEKTDPLFA